jgi:SAM-dependent methyltransferase
MSLKQRVEHHARKRRAALFRALIERLKPASILDVGGTAEYWADLGLQGAAERIVLLNVFPQSCPRGFESVVGDARDLSRYADGEFDLVFSNSVIGHVGGFEDQRRMAREIRRVGKRFFLQTPNHGFPIDWRTLVPFFHFMPARAQAWCFERFSVGTYLRAKDSAEAMEWATRIRNIRARELPILFPGAAVVRERVAGFTKSFMVHDLCDL